MNTVLQPESVEQGFYFKGLAAGPGISRHEAVDLIASVQRGEARVTVSVTTGDGITRPLPFRPIQMIFCG